MDLTILGQEDQVKTFIPKFQSLRTTKLLFSNGVVPPISDTSLRSQKVIALIRSKWKQTVHYINNNGGFTIVCWWLRGSVTNKTSNEEELNEEVEHHCCYLFPTRASPASVPKLTIEDIEHAEGINNQPVGPQEDNM
jgi:hypothetical protein